MAGVPALPGPLADVDRDGRGNWVGVAGEGADQVVLFNGAAVKPPRPCRFPVVRRIGEQAAVLVDTRIGRSGDGVQDLLASPEWIVVTYFDEGVFGMHGPNQEGLAVFSARGELAWGYRTKLGRRAVGIDDCYAACWVREGQVAFIPYTEFPLVMLTLGTAAQTVHPTPRELHGAGALAVRGDVVYAWSPYDQRHAILWWKIGARSAHPVGTHPGPLRGLPGGEFLARGASGCTIVSPA